MYFAQCFNREWKSTDHINAVFSIVYHTLCPFVSAENIRIRVFSFLDKGNETTKHFTEFY